MEKFCMEIAGAVILVQPLFESTREYCRAYLSEKTPEFFVEILPEDLGAEQLRLEEEAVAQGLKLRKFKDPFLERSVIQRRVADYLLGKNVLLLHGSTVAVDGNAYLFTAPCGTGKSTHTRLWREMFGQRAVMVNDDKPFLRLTASGVTACGSPWSGKHGIATNISVPLKGICLLRRGEANRIRRARREAVSGLLREQVHMPSDPVLAEKSLALLEEISDCVPLWTMDCNRDPEAALVSYEAMKNP